ncbi:MAG: hypothetical protein ABIU85_11145 [Methylotenera sp.]
MGFSTPAPVGGTAFKVIPAGSFVARCYEFIDLGTQTAESGKYIGKQDHKIKIGFELFGDDEDGSPLTIDIDGKEMPLTITKDYTYSMHEKANLRKDLGAWRGKMFGDEEAATFETLTLLGAYCMLNITHKEDAQGKVRANISGISPLPGALKNNKPKPVHVNRVFDLDKPDMAMFDTFYEYMQETIKKSPEWKAATSGKQQSTESENPNPFTDDIPF